MSALTVVRGVERELAAAGVPEPRTDAELLVSHVLAVPRSAVSLAEVGEEELTRLRPLVARRARREPLQHVLGEWGFRRLTLRVDGRALVPRPETEVVVERCLARLRDVPKPRVADVGTGTGAIALALADEHPAARVVATDTSAAALELARENADAAGLAGRVAFVHGDLLSGLRGSFDLVVANPPYVDEEELPFLEPEVRDHEPLEALLDAGQTDVIARGALELLRPGGALVLEVAAGAAARVGSVLAQLGYVDVATARDLAGIERVVEAEAPPAARA